MDRWTERKIEELIGFLKQYPLLWDVRHKDYKNRPRKQQALTEISKIINLPSLELERKMNVLITQYRRARKKYLYLANRGVDPNEIPARLWSWYEKLSFLEDRFQALASHAAIPQDDNNTEHIWLHTTEDIDEMKPSISDYKEVVKPTNYGEDDNEDATIENSINKRPKSDHAEGKECYTLLKEMLREGQGKDKDEYDAFGEYIAIKLKKMDHVTRLELQNKINNLIFETELKILRQNQKE